MRITVTGAAGFIGSHLSRFLIEQGHQVQGIDSLDPYYSVNLKKVRVKEIESRFEPDEFRFIHLDICEEQVVEKIAEYEPEVVFHLAAQAGVRQNLKGLKSYSRNNIEGFLRILEAVKIVKPRNFLFASSSSVYGSESTSPFNESEKNLFPSSIYGVTKLANELLARAVMKDSETRCRGLRFFTVYGPGGRPDMAYFRAIAVALLDQEFTIYGSGDVRRDFTYVDDVIESIYLLNSELMKRQSGHFDVVNVGGGNPVTINDMLEIIGNISNRKISLKRQDASRDDLPLTFCDPQYLFSLIDKKSFTPIESGLKKTFEWFESKSKEELGDWLRP